MMSRDAFRLAWLQLAKEKRRLSAAVAGIAFAALLILVQLGFKESLLQSAALVFSHLRCDLVLINPEYENLTATGQISRRRLYQALGFDGVRSINYLNASQISWKNPRTRRDRVILVIGFDPQEGVFDLPGVDRNVRELRIPGRALFDAGSRPEFGDVASELDAGRRVITEAAGRRIEVTGTFKMGTSFAMDGTLLVSDQDFSRLVSGFGADLAGIGLIRLKPGVDAEKARERLAAALPQDVLVLTRRQLMDRELDFWTSDAPVGFVFNLGVVMGLFVGCVIVYQILYTDVSAHLGEYATLKAMGYPERFLSAVVLHEALILSLAGFLPGLFISALVYRVAEAATLLPMRMSIARAAGVYLLTAAMCALSGALAMRKLASADPAEIF